MSTRANLPEPRSAHAPARHTTDVLLIGGGIMSATLGSLITSLEPDWSVTLLERLDGPARESSDPWNNAGTGHAALCELNYTPRLPDGSVDVSKALKINEQFQLSRQLWSYAVENGQLGDPSTFINPVPHVSFVHGEENVAYLRARYDALASNPLFEGIEYIDDHGEFARRLPLMAEGRDAQDKVALSWSDRGTDVDFGALTRQLLSELEKRGTDVRYGRQVKHLTRDTDGTWAAKVKDLRTGSVTTVRARFVFVGAGGGALHLLQKAGIEEIKGFAGFPVSGQFVRCLNTDIASQHHAKVYGLAPVGAPPMSVPHLDTRVVNGQRSLLFGPYAGWSPKFLKNGSVTDLPRSIRWNNIAPIIGVGLTSMPLVKYLVLELLKSQRSRIEDLRAFAPTARTEDWELITAGQRVQVVRKKGRGGSLEFGTSIISARDGSIAGLLGASPGASTSVAAMLEVLERCFSSRMEAWKPKLKEMVPSYGVSLQENPSLLADLRSWTDRALKLTRQDEQATQR
ncbi:malate dehydrogenase (quinone) [uncultured Aeromicrobium sp.]|uniref:malate dehydrogenase (quinone) n=1 Tax=uncultured Aeromicrobium sp. TaxID=337820 RepID=UPI0025D538E6|nr:malate dehydrogenase (quinone) [uncultured Aeromicrobium sp.]